MPRPITSIEDIQWNEWYPDDPIPRGDDDKLFGCLYTLVGVGVGLIASAVFGIAVVASVFN